MGEWTKGEVTGAIVELTSDYMVVKGQQGQRKIWKGKQYQGPKPPPVGTFIKASYAESPPKDGFKYGAKYLDGWETAVEPENGSVEDSWADASESPQNGSQAPQTASHGQKSGSQFVGRDPGLADYWLAMRWSYSLAHDIIKATDEVVTVDRIAHVAGELFSRSHSDALWKYEQWEEAPPQGSNNG